MKKIQKNFAKSLEKSFRIYYNNKKTTKQNEGTQFQNCNLFYEK